MPLSPQSRTRINHLSSLYNTKQRRRLREVLCFKLVNAGGRGCARGAGCATPRIRSYDLEDVLRFFVLILIPLMAAAEERWIEIRSGPFQVVSNAGDKPAREVLNELEQVRYVVGTALGKEDLKSTWPFRVLVLKSAQGAPVSPRLSRDTYTASVSAGGQIPPGWLRECVRILIDSNSGRMPAGIESGMESFYSTAQAAGTKVTLGAAPPPQERNLDWARIHLLVTNPEYAGRLRVLLYNLQRGADLEPAFKNAFMKGAAEIDKEAGAFLASGSTQTVMIGGRALSPLRDFTVTPMEGASAAAAQADLRLADGRDTTEAYRGLLPKAPAEAHEGLGLIAIAAKREDEARKELGAAVEAKSTSARAWLEAARLNRDETKARGELQKAAELNPNWAEPYVVLAAIETDPTRKLQWLKTATTLDPRNAANWQGVAELYQTHNKYAEAAKAWAAAEDASVDEAERERIREARRSIEEKRLEYEAAEHKKREDERQRDIQRAKDSAMAEIHAAEARANQGRPAPDPNRKLEQMEVGEAPSGKVHGQLAQIDCLGRMARLVIRTEGGKQAKLLIRDPKSVVVLSGETLSLGCGAQKPVRTVSIEYEPKANAKLGTAGEVVTVRYE
jgi:hypothetical protein